MSRSQYYSWVIKRTILQQDWVKMSLRALELNPTPDWDQILQDKKIRMD